MRQNGMNAPLESQTHRRRGVAVRAACLGFLIGSLMAFSAHAATTDQASGFVKAEAANATALLGNRALAPAERAHRFEALITAGFDLKSIARYVCGPVWSTATTEQKQRFLKVFQGALARIYSDRLRDYSGEAVEVTDARSVSGGAVVTTAVTGGNSRDTRYLDWNVVEVGKSLKLFDVVIDGVSTAEMTLEDYGAVLDDNGGDPDALSTRLAAGKK